MRILVVSDIHGNWPALAAILRRETFDVCLNIGDLVDYGPFSRECVRWARENCAETSVRGNHDHGVCQGIGVTGDHGYRYLTRVSRPYQWPALDAEDRRFLTQLPVTRRLVLDGRRFLLVHGTPRDPLDEYVMCDIPVWNKRVANTEADIVCVGHTHMQFYIPGEPTAVLNPGTVGQPRDGDPRPAYAVIEGNEITLKRADYDAEETLRAFEALDIPDRAKEMYRECLKKGRLPPAAKLARPEEDLPVPPSA